MAEGLRQWTRKEGKCTRVCWLQTGERIFSRRISQGTMLRPMPGKALLMSDSPNQEVTSCTLAFHRDRMAHAKFRDS